MKLMPVGVDEKDLNSVGVQYSVKLDELLTFKIPEDEMKKYFVRPSKSDKKEKKDKKK